MAYVDAASGNAGTALADGSGARLVTSGGGVLSLAWSPDASRLVLAMQTGGLSLVSADSSGLTPLVDAGGPSATAPDWSPVGGWIVFSSIRSGSWNFWVIHPDGSGLQQIDTSGVQGMARWKK